MKKKIQIIIGLALIGIFVLLAIAAPILAPNDPNATDLSMKNALPSREYPLGCDQMGRCELSRFDIWSTLFIGIVYTNTSSFGNNCFVCRLLFKLQRWSC